MKNFDSQMQAYDSATAELYREIENGRMFRLMAKLGAINERQEFDGDRQWSENGDRYMLKLFRDYVFHQVDANGQPVVNIGHIVSCLNKLDAGTEERICLTSRDEQSVFIVSYKELKKQIGSAFGDLLKGNSHKARGL
jgi:PAB-dependent poly(A)-specific ribonuclease subunit 3